MRISRGGGWGPVWNRDGRSLYYQNENSIYRVSVTGGARVVYGRPQLLFDSRPEQLAMSDGFDVLPDGSGLVMVQQLPFEEAAVIYVQNWLAEFRKRP